MSRAQRTFTRRQAFKAAAVTTVGLSFAGAPVLNIRKAGAQETKLTWMSNQRHDRAVKEALFARYAEETGVQVEMQIFADEYPDQLKLAFESGTPPDMFNMNQPRQQAEAGWSIGMSDLLEADPDLYNSFIPGAFLENQGIYDGEIYGLPMYAQTLRMYYNKRLYEAAGLDPNAPATTYTELREHSKAIADAGTGAYGFIFGDKFPWVWDMNVLRLAGGAGAYPFEWNTGQFNFNQDGFKEAMAMIVGMNEDGSLFPGAHTLTDDDARQQFSIGMAGIIIGGSWNPGVFNDQFESTEDWETAHLPFPDGGQKGRIRQYIGDRYTISAQSQNQEAAWEFLKWLYSVPIMTEMYELGMGVMGVAAANTGESDVRGIPNLAPTENDVIPPPEPELPTVTPDANTTLQMIFDDPGSMDSALEEATTRYNDIYQAAIDDGSLVAEDFLIPDWDGMSWTAGGDSASPEASPAASPAA
ncbi:MAG TPA: extracellular solute-binding protein [Thermomicrobiales bacterium]|nr:extracellular solute-binding protein [Thermomicrobiales bacterium]